MTQCTSCAYNTKGHCERNNSAYPFTLVCNRFSLRRIETMVIPLPKLLDKKEPKKPAKPAQTEFEFRDPKDKSKVLYYAYLPEEN